MFTVLGLAGDAFDLWPIAVLLILSIWMIFFARPLSVFTGLLPFRGFNLRGAHFHQLGRTARRGADYSRRFPDDGRAKARLFFQCRFLCGAELSLLLQGIAVWAAKGQSGRASGWLASIARGEAASIPDNPWEQFIYQLSRQMVRRRGVARPAYAERNSHCRAISQ